MRRTVRWTRFFLSRISPARAILAIPSVHRLQSPPMAHGFFSVINVLIYRQRGVNGGNDHGARGEITGAIAEKFSSRSIRSNVADGKSLVCSFASNRMMVDLLFGSRSRDRIVPPMSATAKCACRGPYRDGNKINSMRIQVVIS